VNTCGGTHVSSLAEIQAIHLVDAEPARGGARIRFLAGGRALRELRRLQDLERDLKQRLGTSAREFGQVLDGWQAERKRLERRARDLERIVAEGVAARLATVDGERVGRVVPGAGPEMLREIASAFLEMRPAAIVVLVGHALGSREEPVFLVQSGPRGPEDVSALADRVGAALGAKGGGAGRRYQGRGGRCPSEEIFGALLD